MPPLSHAWFRLTSQASSPTPAERVRRVLEVTATHWKPSDGRRRGRGRHGGASAASSSSMQAGHAQ